MTFVLNNPKLSLIDEDFPFGMSMLASPSLFCKR